MLMEIIFTVAALVIAYPFALLALEVLSAIIHKPAQTPLHEGPLTLAILIPAHDEEIGIEKTIEALIPHLDRKHRLLVVADNCTDNTAKIAKKAGAEVIERSDANNRGKGFALDFGIQHLKSNPPEVVIVVDADCVFTEGSVDVLARIVLQTGRPVQALNLSSPPTNSSVGQQVSAFAMILKNHVRLLGLKAWGLPCHLLGTGMAFPWKIISHADLANGNIVEDMKLGVDLVREGNGTLYCPLARVDSVFPESSAGQEEQRTRWEHGHLQTIMSLAPKLLWDSLRQRKWRNLVFALDLAIPPLSLAVYIMCAGLVFTGLTAFFGVGLFAFFWLICISILFFASLGLAWWYFGRTALPPKSLRGVPGYILSKISVYVKFIKNRQKDWVRSERN